VSTCCRGGRRRLPREVVREGRLRLLGAQDDGRVDTSRAACGDPRRSQHRSADDQIDRREREGIVRCRVQEEALEEAGFACRDGWPAEFLQRLHVVRARRAPRRTATVWCNLRLLEGAHGVDPQHAKRRNCGRADRDDHGYHQGEYVGGQIRRSDAEQP
jgi:hypothetical protein